MSDYSVDFRIGTNAGADLIRLIHRGIPNPERWTFTPFSTSYITADGVSRGDGYPSTSWVWEVLSQHQLNTLLGFFSADTDASVEVYIRTHTERGVQQATGDYKCIMHRPIVGESKEMIPQSRYPVWENVTVHFTRLEAA